MLCYYTTLSTQFFSNTFQQYMPISGCSSHIFFTFLGLGYSLVLAIHNHRWTAATFVHILPCIHCTWMIKKIYPLVGGSEQNHPWPTEISSLRICDIGYYNLFVAIPTKKGQWRHALSVFCVLLTLLCILICCQCSWSLFAFCRCVALISDNVHNQYPKGTLDTQNTHHSQLVKSKYIWDPDISKSKSKRVALLLNGVCMQAWDKTEIISLFCCCSIRKCDLQINNYYYYLLFLFFLIFACSCVLVFCVGALSDVCVFFLTHFDFMWVKRVSMCEAI